MKAVPAFLRMLLLLLLGASRAFVPVLSWKTTATSSADGLLGGSTRRSWYTITTNRRSPFLLFAEPSCTSGPEAVRSQPPSPTNATHLQMVSFYRFRSKDVEDWSKESLRDDIFDALATTVAGVRGSLYLADEGFNGQFAVPLESLEAFIGVLESHLPGGLDLNYGDVVPMETPTFQRLIVRVRDAILRDGMDLNLDWEQAGDELAPEVWDQELRREASPPPILDCRNDYESNQGTFQKALPLNTTTFAESWETLQRFSETVSNKDDPVYIFCTGGIRCVKVGAYMKQSLGFTNVKRLKHGIIGYQRWADHNQQEQPSLWQGENFLFDKRRFAEGDEVNEMQ